MTVEMPVGVPYQNRLRKKEVRLSEIFYWIYLVLVKIPEIISILQMVQIRQLFRSLLDHQIHHLQLRNRQQDTLLSCRQQPVLRNWLIKSSVLSEQNVLIQKWEWDRYQ